MFGESGGGRWEVEAEDEYEFWRKGFGSRK